MFTGASEQVAQGLTLPFHMGAMQPALDGVLAQFAGDVEPGDILASNDPCSGASHLPDIFLFKARLRRRVNAARLPPSRVYNALQAATRVPIRHLQSDEGDTAAGGPRGRRPSA